MKTKETNDVPPIMSSLWKKLDHTLSQIRSMQNSPGFAANQRARTRNGIAEIKRQRRLASQTVPSNFELLPLPCLPEQFAASPLTAAQVFTRPAGQISTPLRSNFVVVNHSQSQDTVNTGETLNIISGPQEKKNHASLMSPGRRKSESQRKGITLSGPHSTIRNFQDPNAFEVEKQMVIENAREKILSNKSLQEKLAENINKFLTSDNNIAQVPKQTDSNPTEPETSIDELLGLQNEIHMSEEVIQDILEQTESDPAFQALFDLFDYDYQSGGPSFCTSFQNEETATALNNVSSHNELRQEAQEQFSIVSPGIQKKAFKIVVPTEQKCNLDINFESVPNLNDFNQRENSGPECNQHCADLYTSEMSTETEIALAVEKNSLCPDVQNESQLQPNQSDMPVTTFVSLDGETDNENVILPGKSTQLLSQSAPLTGKSSKTIKFSETSNDGGGLKTSLPGSKSPDSNEMNQSKLEVNEVLSVGSQLSDCQDSSLLQHKILLESTESSGLNVSEQQKELHPGDSVSSNKQPPNDSSSAELNNAEHETQHSESEKGLADSQEPLSSIKENGDNIFMSLGENDNCEEVTVRPPEGDIENKRSLRSESVCSSTGNSYPESEGTSDKPTSSSSDEIDGANIVSLKIIISDDPFVSSDTELSSAVSSISGENLPTIILSSSTKSSAQNAELAKDLSSKENTPSVSSKSSSAEEVEDSASVEQSVLAVKPEDSAITNTQNEDAAFSAKVGSSVSKDTRFIQLMPATTTTFGSSNNILIATCVTDPTALGATVAQSNVVVLPGNSAPMPTQPPAPQLQTPPRSNGVFALGQPVSPNFSQGSAIIIASPVQPVLQGMVGMIPVSVVGQNGNTFSAPRQVLPMPLAAPVCNRNIAQLPIPPKSQRTQGLRSKQPTGKQVNNLVDSSSHLIGCHAQRNEVSDKNRATELGDKKEDIATPNSAGSSPQTGRVFESHRRVLCFDSSTPQPTALRTEQQTATQSKDQGDISSPSHDSQSGSAALKLPSSNVLKREKLPVPKILSKSETAGSRHSNIKETQSEKKAAAVETALESFHKTTANKENELCTDVERQKNPETSKLSNGQQNGGLWNEKTIASLQEITKKQGSSSTGKSVISVGSAGKDLKQEHTKSSSSLTNPLTKHSTEMFRDGQWPSPVNRVPDSIDLPIPRTPGLATGEKHKEEPTDRIKVPSTRRLGEDSGTPKIMVPPIPQDLPACSPASETGSENSVNMAAHTLMILSRAAIARTASTTPLKDNTQQFRASARSTTKKRKIEELDDRERNSRTSGKNLTNSSIPVKKKKFKKKKLPSSFPAGMDVDKFLLSLHYDE